MALSEDVSKAISWVHLSGTLHDTVGADPDRYIHPSPGLGRHLAEARAGGKKLFLLTNSALGFVDQGMQFLIGEQWQSLFDVVITSAQKVTAAGLVPTTPRVNPHPSFTAPMPRIYQNLP